MHSRFSPRRLALKLSLLCAALAAAACGPSTPGGPSRSADAVTVASDPVLACVSNDAHDKHKASGVSCVSCHPCGGVFGFSAAVTYPDGTTTAGGTITVESGTTPTSCSVGCHYPQGSPAHSVSWDAGTLACTDCHDVTTLLVRTPGHPEVPASAPRALCETCHDQTAHTSGTVTVTGHDEAWVDTMSPTFHAFSANQGLSSCQGCHGRNLGGSTTGAVGCESCHNGGAAPMAKAWSCVLCHGGIDNQTGAPPKATWGMAGDPLRGGGVADPVRVGAHTTHVAQSDIAPDFGCAVCHVTPADPVAPGHVDGGTAEVTFAGVAVNGVTPAPAWDRATGTCSNTYCHGATMAKKNPVWTAVGQGEGDCGTCHGVPPPPPHPAVDVTEGLARCAACHDLTIDETGALIPPRTGGKHLNGLLEASGHDGFWMDTSSTSFHAFSVNRNIEACTGCHGQDLKGGATGISCGQCHDQSLPAGVASWDVNCVMCHGGVANQTGAPPRATWGFAGDPARGGGLADPLRVGAHTKHVQATIAGPFDCGTCHVKPTSALSPGHIALADGGLATVTWSGRAIQGGANPVWNRPAGTCASTYCHGNYSGVYVYENWDWDSDSLVTIYAPYSGKKATPGWIDGPMTCASCHGNPPADGSPWHSGYHGNKPEHNYCQLCHPDATTVAGAGNSITTPSQHVNGILEVTPRWTSACMGCH
jgi:predicted CxxxxCH...CXXCH cytochrome family protein